MNAEQDDEMTALKAIYGDEFEYARNAAGEYSGKLTINVNVPSDASVLVAGSIQHDSSNGVHNEDAVIRRISSLPPITLFFTLSANYPKHTPPHLTIACIWLSVEQRNELEKQMVKIWELEPDVILFQCADLLQQDIISTINISFPLILADEVVPMVIKNDQAKEQQHFDETRHYCSICLEGKLGQACHSLPCGHVFCRACLVDFFTLLIKEGNVMAVQCPDTACIKSRSKLSPSDIETLVGPVLYQRYQDLIEKNALETDSSITWCPRRTCQGPARKDTDYEKLAICRKCQFAFCFYCRHSWHGVGQFCAIDNQQRIVEEYEQANVETKRRMELQYGTSTLQRIISDVERQRETKQWIENNTTVCPTCLLNIEKAFGCNHMQCSMCGTHFCYLCGSCLTANSALYHFNTPGNRCFQRLFENLGADADQLAFEMAAAMDDR
ncbi:hypothetical protein BDF19DRAFT_433006 [Syncephalis fuscata]|nr:hypothetical protein BDF19DRAFT_433006 [Syncephalis fuscata]